MHTARQYHVSKYVTIQDCSLLGMDVHGSTDGMTGVKLFNCDHVTVKDIEDWYCGVGISVTSCDRTAIENSTFLGSTIGIELGTSSDCLLADNAIEKGTNGIHLVGSVGDRLYRNAISGAKVGIWLNSSSNNILVSNVMAGCGLLMDDLTSICSQTIASSNTVNGLPVVYLKGTDLAGAELGPSAGQVILAQVSHGVLRGTSITNGTVGTVLGGCEDLELNGGSSIGNDIGVQLVGCRNIEVSHCSISGNGGEGILATSCTDLLIDNNTISGNSGLGISLICCSGGTIVANDLLANNGCVGGINTYHQASDINGSNTWYRNGKGNHWSDLTAPDDDGNGIVDTPYALLGGAFDLYPLVDETMTCGIWIDSDAELVRAAATNGWSGDGTALRPYQIGSLNLVGWGALPTVHIGNTTLYILFHDVNVLNEGASGTAMEIINAKNVTIYQCRFTQFATSIMMNGTGAALISGCDLSGGLRVVGNQETWDGLATTSDNTVDGGGLAFVHDVEDYGVIDCTGAGQLIIYNVTGASIRDWTIDGTSYPLQMAYCQDMLIDDMRSEPGITAVLAWHCSDVKISNCSFSAGSGNGLVLSGCSGVAIADCDVTSFGGYGAMLAGCSDCQISRNSFSANHGSGSSYRSSCVQAYDDGGNAWNGTKKGNRWSDWLAPDADGDRIVDKAYVIDGGSYDLLPLVLGPSVDIEGPMVIIDSPAAGITIPTDEATIEWTVHDNESAISSIVLLLDGNVRSDVTGLSSYTFDSLTDGAHIMTVRAKDASGNTAVHSVTIRTDALGPSIGLASLTNGSAVRSASFTIGLALADAGSYVTTASSSLDAGGWTAIPGSSVSVTGLSEGWHRLNVNATDASGHEAQAWFEFYVDMTLPDVQLYSVPSTVSSHSLVVEWNSWDNQSGKAWTGLRLDGGSWSSPSVDGRAAITLKDGHHTLTLAVVDAAGNRREVSISFLSDADPPVVSFMSATSATSSDQMPISWTGTDLGVGIEGYAVRIDGGNWIDVGTSTSYTFEGLAEGKHTVELMATDLLGHSGTVRMEFWVDSEAPQLEILSPLDGNLTAANSTYLSWTSSDIASLVTMMVQVDDGAFLFANGTDHISLVLNEGEHKLTVIAIDLAGNRATRSVNITIDRTAPSAKLYGPTGLDCPIDGDIWVVADEKVENVIAYVNGAPLPNSSCSIDGTDINLTFALSHDRDYAVSLILIDTAGNTRNISFSFHTTAIAVWSGRVVDRDGAAVVGAVVSAGNTTCVTGSDGSYSLRALYNITEVTVTAPGMAARTISVDQLALGDVVLDRQTASTTWAVPLLIIIAAFALIGTVVVIRRRK